MNYTHLSIEERCCLRKYYNEGNSLRKIAELMGRNVSTIAEAFSSSLFLNALLIIAIFRPKGMFSFMTDLKYVTNYIIYNIADVM